LLLIGGPKEDEGGEIGKKITVSGSTSQTALLREHFSETHPTLGKVVAFAVAVPVRLSLVDRFCEGESLSLTTRDQWPTFRSEIPTQPSIHHIARAADRIRLKHWTPLRVFEEEMALVAMWTA